MSETYFKIVQGEGKKTYTHIHIDIHIYGYGELMDVLKIFSWWTSGGKEDSVISSKLVDRAFFSNIFMILTFIYLLIWNKLFLTYISKEVWDLKSKPPQDSHLRIILSTNS